MVHHSHDGPLGMPSQCLVLQISIRAFCQIRGGHIIFVPGSVTSLSYYQVLPYSKVTLTFTLRDLYHGISNFIFQLKPKT